MVDLRACYQAPLCVLRLSQEDFARARRHKMTTVQDVLNKLHYVGRQSWEFDTVQRFADAVRVWFLECVVAAKGVSRVKEGET